MSSTNRWRARGRRLSCSRWRWNLGVGPRLLAPLDRPSRASLPLADEAAGARHEPRRRARAAAGDGAAAAAAAHRHRDYRRARARPPHDADRAAQPRPAGDRLLDGAAADGADPPAALRSRPGPRGRGRPRGQGPEGSRGAESASGRSPGWRSTSTRRGRSLSSSPTRGRCSSRDGAGPFIPTTARA
jgi:hypothetical protein